MRNFLIALALSACVGTGVAQAKNCNGTSVGFTPLPALGAGVYLGEQGGLYPGGANQPPAAHLNLGLSLMDQVVPRAADGTPDPVNGWIVLISIGMSNTTQEYSRFVQLANADPEKNPRVYVLDTAQGGQHAGISADSSSAYWDNVMQRLANRGLTPAQVQAAWVKQAVPGPNQAFPADAQSLQRLLAATARNLHAFFPNLRLTYWSSRIYAGYASTLLNPEPYAYQSGFSVKWLIADQIAGVDSLNADSTQGAVGAPWMAWGPYLWADGLTPRPSDGLIWVCDDFADDGTHPGTPAREKVADMLLDFFKSDATTAPWFVAPGTVSAPQPSARLQMAAPSPNPAAGEVRFAWQSPAGSRVRLAIVNPAGRRTVLGEAFTASGSYRLRDARLPAGMYWVVAEAGAERVTRRFVWLGR